jgi:archaellum biogenesis ATPase FlaH
MEKQLVNAERPLAGRQTGLPSLVSSMAGKLTALNVQTLKTWTDAHVSLIPMMIYPVQTSFDVEPGIGMKILPLSKAKM